MKQITILSHDRKDLVGDITDMLSKAGINLESVTARSFDSQAIATITSPDHDRALEILQSERDLQVVSEDVLIVRVADETGALAKISRRFSDADIQIRSLRFVERNQGYALVAISTERSDKALDIVKDILVT